VARDWKAIAREMRTRETELDRIQSVILNNARVTLSYRPLNKIYLIYKVIIFIVKGF